LSTKESIHHFACIHAIYYSLSKKTLKIYKGQPKKV
jgi:hypothetical protein